MGLNALEMAKIDFLGIFFARYTERNENFESLDSGGKNVDALWVSTLVFSLVCLSTFGAIWLIKGQMNTDSQSEIESQWLPENNYSADDSLDHPDLGKIVNLKKSQESESREGTP